MTEEERARLRLAKAEVSESLRKTKWTKYRKVSIADKRIMAYVREVAKNPDRHNLYEQLAVRHFLKMVDRYGFNQTAVRHFFYVYEHLYFPGKRGEQNYELTPVQAFQFASIYGFWDGDKRIVREACLYVPRKFSKTTSTASLAVYDLLFGDSNAEAYVGANSADQAKKCFDVIRGCMFRLDPNGTRYVVNEERIKSKRKDRSAFAQCLTANARTKDGLNASTVIMDEFSQARDSKLLTVLTTSMGVRDNPLTVIITTASDVFDGPFYEMLQGYKSVLLGDYEDDSLFVHIFEPDIDDKENDPATWRKVHPHLGITVTKDFYQQEWLKAQRNGADAMLAFRTKLLNVYSENSAMSWIPAAEIRKRMTPIKPGAIGTNLQAMIAIDLSEKDDFSAVSICYYKPEGNDFYFHTKYFLPEGSLPGHYNERLYRAWAQGGHLTLLKGDVIDYDAITDYVLELIDGANVLGIGYDPYKSRQMVNELAAHPDAVGAETVLQGISQSYLNFVAPTQMFEHGLLTGHVYIDDNPINAYCFGNAVLDYDKMENFKPVKRQPNNKIDGVITKLMCMRQWLDLLQTPSIS